MTNGTQVPMESGYKLRLLADELHSGHAVGLRDAIAGAWQILTAARGAFAAAAALWFVGAAAVAATAIAMPVAAQFVLLIGGITIYLAATGFLGRTAILTAVGHPPTAAQALHPDLLWLRYMGATTLIAGGTTAIAYFAAGTGSQPIWQSAAAAIVIVTALLTFTPLNSALGDPLPRAAASSARAVLTPRYILIAVVVLLCTAASLTVPLLGLILMPMQIAALAYCRTRDPRVKQISDQ